MKRNMNFFLGFPGGFARHPCYYCFFPDFDKNFSWPIRHISQEESVSPYNIIFPFLHIKLGLLQKFVKTLPKDGECNIWFKNPTKRKQNF